MDILLQQIINGVVLGAIYALVALGYTMVYGILELINFAHGEILMIGAMVALSVMQMLAGSGLPGPLIVFAGLAVAIVVCMAVAFTVERVAYRPLRHAPRLAPLITAIGVSILLQNLAAIIWGKQYLPMPGVLAGTPFEIGGATMTTLQVFIVVLSGALMAGLLLLVKTTQLGRAMRGTPPKKGISGPM